MPVMSRPPRIKISGNRQLPGIILPVRIALSTQISNMTDVVINGHQVTIRANELEFREELGKLARFQIFPFFTMFFSKAN